MNNNYIFIIIMIILSNVYFLLAVSGLKQQKKLESAKIIIVDRAIGNNPDYFSLFVPETLFPSKLQFDTDTSLRGNFILNNNQSLNAKNTNKNILEVFL